MTVTTAGGGAIGIRVLPLSTMAGGAGDFASVLDRKQPADPKAAAQGPLRAGTADLAYTWSVKRATDGSIGGINSDPVEDLQGALTSETYSQFATGIDGERATGAKGKYLLIWVGSIKDEVGIERWRPTSRQSCHCRGDCLRRSQGLGNHFSPIRQQQGAMLVE